MILVIASPVQFRIDKHPRFCSLPTCLPPLFVRDHFCSARIILAIDKYAALYVFTSTADAERELEAIDVRQSVFEFCDSIGQRYSPTYIIPPKVSRLGGIEIGTFKLRAIAGIDSQLPEE